MSLSMTDVLDRARVYPAELQFEYEKLSKNLMTDDDHYMQYPDPAPSTPASSDEEKRGHERSVQENSVSEAASKNSKSASCSSKTCPGPASILYNGVMALEEADLSRLL